MFGSPTVKSCWPSAGEHYGFHFTCLWISMDEAVVNTICCQNSRQHQKHVQFSKNICRMYWYADCLDWAERFNPTSTRKTHKLAQSVCSRKLLSPEGGTLQTAIWTSRGPHNVWKIWCLRFGTSRENTPVMLEISEHNPRALFGKPPYYDIDFLNSATGVVFRNLWYLIWDYTNC